MAWTSSALRGVPVGAREGETGVGDQEDIETQIAGHAVAQVGADVVVTLASPQDQMIVLNVHMGDLTGLISDSSGAAKIHA